MRTGSCSILPRLYVGFRARVRVRVRVYVMTYREIKRSICACDIPYGSFEVQVAFRSWIIGVIGSTITVFQGHVVTAYMTETNTLRFGHC